MPPIAAPDGMERAVELGVQAFYARHTFHGPRLHGLEAVLACTATSITAAVRGSRPRDWCPHDPRAAWHLDPLVVDAAFQLALYWAWVTDRVAILPRSIAEVALLRPFAPDRPVRVRLEALPAAQGERAGTFWLYQDEALAGWMRDVRARVLAGFGAGGG